jgi:hypothetical protein
MATAKLDLVRRAFASAEITRWYSEQHDAYAADFTVSNVHEYGLNGLGELADSVIQDAYELGVLHYEDVAVELGLD